MGRLTLILGEPFLGPRPHYARELNTHILHSVFRQWMQNSLTQRLPHHGGLHPQTVGPNKLSLSRGPHRSALDHPCKKGNKSSGVPSAQHSEETKAAKMKAEEGPPGVKCRGRGLATKEQQEGLPGEVRIVQKDCSDGSKTKHM